MSTPRVIRDPEHPDFPHGEARGYQRGCTTDEMCPATPTCRAMRRRQNKQSRVDRQRGKAGVVDATEVLAHVDRLISVTPGASLMAFAQAAGVAPATLTEMRERACVSARVARALLAVTRAQLAEACRLVEVEAARHIVRTLQAAGFPLTWQSRRTGLWGLSNIAGGGARNTLWVHRETYERLVALAEEVGTRMADPEVDQIPVREITKARGIARRAGYYPPGAYDADRHLDVRALPDHPWAVADTYAGRLLDMAHALCTVGVREGQGVARESIRADGRLGRKQCERVVAKLGMTFRDEHRRELLPVEHARINGAIIARVVAVYSDYDTGRLGPVEAALKLGLMPHGAGANSVPRDHPELVRFLAERERDSGAA